MENKNYNELCKKLEKIRGAEVYENDEERYVELAMITDDNINMAISIIKEYGYEVTEQHECTGSDYDSYCIWFTKTEKIYESSLSNPDVILALKQYCANRFENFSNPCKGCRLRSSQFIENKYKTCIFDNCPRDWRGDGDINVKIQN